MKKEKQYTLTIGTRRPHCEFCKRRLVIQWAEGNHRIWACLWHTRRAWRELKEGKS